MVRTFNLGVGLTCVVRPDLVEAAQAAVPEARRIGAVVPVAPGADRVSFI
jgi:phosphoribosylaminoimidazole (AIR) synthetase